MYEIISDIGLLNTKFDLGQITSLMWAEFVLCDWTETGYNGDFLLLNAYFFKY